MIRALFLAAALVAGMTLPVLAADATTEAAPAATESTGPAYQNLFTQDQARQHLMHLGYTNISALTKDEDGKWVGTATKDGKTLVVAVDVKGPATRPVVTN